MKRMARLACAAAIALVLTACRASDEEEDAVAIAEQINNISEVTVTNALDMGNGPPPESAANLNFPSDAAIYNGVEIAISKVAVNQGYSLVVRTFAEKALWVHTQAVEWLEEAAAGNPAVKLPEMTSNRLRRERQIKLPPEERRKINALIKLGGAEFDQVYAVSQTEALGNILARMKDYAEHGNIMKVKIYAERMIPILERLLDEAASLPR